MSRRKQSNPRQIKRSVDEMEKGEENLTDDNNVSERETVASNHDESADCDTSSSFYSEDQWLQDVPKTPEELEVKWSTDDQKNSEMWHLPESLELHHLDSEVQVRACHSLAKGLSWGPFEGLINSSNKNTQESDKTPVTASLQLKEERCWLRQVKITVNEETANCTIYCKDDQIWCKTTKPITEGECLTAVVGPSEQSTQYPVLNLSVKMEPVDPAECSEQGATYPASLHSDIQLLPQQAGMAAILATAVVNKDIFPCKSCGIWYRSERNLQAHLMYYCASRQKSTPTPKEDKLKEPSPHERICPFPQCNKSCPSASSLEIHVRSHSGERPFVCLICLSAFTTKANCERHLKVHTDTLNGVCHGCGFVSTTRDILYSHLVTNHMVCQPGSKSDAHSPGTGVPALPLTAGKVTSPFLNLKCNQCEYIGDSESNLQQHSSLHVVQDAFQCNQCHEKLKNSADLVQHMEIHQGNELQDSMEETKGKEDKGSPSLNKDIPEELNVMVKVKEEPLNLKSDVEVDRTMEGQTDPIPDDASSVLSPRSTLIVKVKSEHSSPTPASSPVHSGTGSIMSEGTVLIPYMFNHETSSFPQASEILAKMSELVHSRLKQGVNNYPILYAGAPIQKGATCYECDITFNNINNYLAHKRLYCSSRHQQADNPAVDETGKDSASINRTEQGAHCPTSVMENQHASSSSQTDSEKDLRIPLVENKAPEIKTEDSAMKDTSSEGESVSRVSEGSRSPSNSVEDFDLDPSKTICEACNIRFTRHETYVVHKRLYCASRHDPPLRRPNSGRVTVLQQTIRTRKRKKLYEIYGSGHRPLPPPSPSEVPIHSPSAGILQNAGASNNVEALKIKQETLSISSRSTDSLSLSTGYMLTAQSSATSSPGSSSDVDGPIDLSKKPRIQEEPLIPAAPLLPALRFSTDYHECTSCKISFNSVENYLTHKKYYCSATTLPHNKVDHLARVKMQSPASMKAKKNRMEIADPLVQADELKKTETSTKCIPESPNVVHGSITPSNSPGMYHCSPDVLQAGPQLSSHVKTFSAPKRTHSVICPYCPLNGPIEGDLVEHFKNAHDLLLTKQLSPGCTVEGTVEDISQGKLMTNSISESSPQNLRVPALSPKSGAQVQKNIPNAKDQRESVSSQSSVESPLQNISPKPLIMPSPNVALKISPVPDSPRDLGFKSLSPPNNVDKSVQTAMSLPSPVQNGNHRYCRLCNIKFSSLSTFIAHKKYYCSSRTAEHVK